MRSNRSKPPRSRIEQHQTSIDIGGIDWVGYYENFRDKHGEPVSYQGRILFPDGWTYSATDFKGPEYPPPEDKLQLWEMQKAYWIIRKAMLLVEFSDLKVKAECIVELQSVKDAPLMFLQTTIKEDGTKEKLSQEFDLTILIDRLDFLTQQITVCDREIGQYKQFIQDQKNGNSNRNETE